MSDGLARRARRACKRVLIRGCEELFPWSHPQLAAALARLGVAKGDSVLVHCSLDGLRGYRGKVAEIIERLQEAVGSDGAILMPTQPFGGSAITFAESGRVFDVRRTPSQMGMLSEVFRRSPGVVRSVHPTHSVAVWGASADAITAAHERASTPCGAGTPYARLAERDGKILFLGVGLEVMTYFHCLEEELEPLMPRSPFTTTVFTLRSRNAAGELVTTQTRLFDPDLSRRRNLHKLETQLGKRRGLHRARLGLATATLVPASDVRRLCLEAARRGEFFYDG